DGRKRRWQDREDRSRSRPRRRAGSEEGRDEEGRKEEIVVGLDAGHGAPRGAVFTSGVGRPGNLSPRPTPGFIQRGDCRGVRRSGESGRRLTKTGQNARARPRARESTAWIFSCSS